MHGAAQLNKGKNIRRTGIPATIDGKPNPQYAEVVLLTLRQRQVCDLVAKGMTNKEIAAELGIGDRTVESHRHAGYQKMGVRNAVELVRKVMGAKE